MKKDKTPSDVLGYQINCPSYAQCPVCYGCRAYRTDLDECKECAKNFKHDICNRELHRADLISKLITKTQVKMEAGTSFSNE